MNVAITMLLEKLPARIQQILLMILEIAIIAVIVYFFFFESLNVVKRGAMTKVSSVPINFFHVNLVVPFSMVVMFWVGLINLWEAFQNILANRKLEIGVTSSQGLK
jgi:TRAP-type C4-dicarboxylate transport system permease small subunit